MPGRILSASAQFRRGQVRVPSTEAAGPAVHLAQELRASVLLPPDRRGEHRPVHSRGAPQPRAAHRHQHDDVRI